MYIAPLEMKLVFCNSKSLSNFVFLQSLRPFLMQWRSYGSHGAVEGRGTMAFLLNISLALTYYEVGLLINRFIYYKHNFNKNECNEKERCFKGLFLRLRTVAF